MHGWRDVVARKFHFERHQGTNAFVVNERQLSQVDQQGRRQQRQYSRVQPGAICRTLDIQSAFYFSAAKVQLFVRPKPAGVRKPIFVQCPVFSAGIL